MSDSLRPHDCSLPGSSVHGILQARILWSLTLTPGGWCQNWITEYLVDVWRVGKLVGVGGKLYTFGVRSVVSRESFKKTERCKISFSMEMAGGDGGIKYMWMYRWPTNTWKNGQHHSLLEKCKSKLQWGTISCQSEWLLSKSLQAINAGEGVEQREPSYTVGGNANWCGHYEGWYGGYI